MSDEKSAMELASEQFNRTQVKNTALNASVIELTDKNGKQAKLILALQDRVNVLSKKTSEKETGLMNETKHLLEDKAKLEARKTELEVDKSISLKCMESMVKLVIDLWGDTFGCRSCYAAIREHVADADAKDQDRYFTMFKMMTPFDTSLERLEEDWKEAEKKARNDENFGPGWSHPEWRAQSLIFDATGQVYANVVDKDVIAKQVAALFQSVERLQGLRGIEPDMDYNEELAAMWLHRAIRMHNDNKFEEKDEDEVFDGKIDFSIAVSDESGDSEDSAE